MRLTHLRYLGLLLVFAATTVVSAQERPSLDNDPALLLHASESPNGDVKPEDLSPEHYTVHGGKWREMSSEEAPANPPPAEDEQNKDTGIATESTDSLNQESSP